VGVLFDNRGTILHAFGTTLRLFGLSAVGALILGTLLASLRVCPIPALRRVAAWYVHIARNTPLVLIFILVTFGLPTVDVRFSFFSFAVLALTLYTSAFVAEAIRSGINAVDAGQAEAARAIGMTFRQNLTLIVLPQAGRAVVPPLANILVALIRNTGVAEAFGVTEASFALEGLARDHPGSLYALFFGIAAGYMVLVFLVAGAARLLERRVLVTR
jgi:glutamate transport system permease protein